MRFYSFYRCLVSYPILADGTTEEDYKFALDVFNSDNCVTLNELKEILREKKNKTPQNDSSPRENVDAFVTFDICDDKHEDLDVNQSDLARTYLSIIHVKVHLEHHYGLKQAICHVYMKSHIATYLPPPTNCTT